MSLSATSSINPQRQVFKKPFLRYLCLNGWMYVQYQLTFRQQSSAFRIFVAHYEAQLEPQK